MACWVQAMPVEPVLKMHQDNNMEEAFRILHCQDSHWDYSYTLADHLEAVKNSKLLIELQQEL